jgi:hypothetical protein
MAYSYHRTITIDHTKVGSADATNFPVLVSGTYTYLKTVANGGKVQNANGYDIGFSSDSGGSSLLSWEVEFYNAATGVFTAWVKVASVSHTVDTVIYLQYGDSGISTFQGGATGAAWDSNFKLIYHLPNGSSLTTADSTSNGVNGTNASMTAGTGQIDGCAVGNGSNGVQINTANNPYASSVFSSNGLSLSAWVNPTSIAGSFSQIVSMEGAYVISVSSGHKLAFEINGTGTDIISSASVPNGSWTHLFATSNAAGSLKTYVNGVADTTGSQSFFNLDGLTRCYSIGGHPTLSGFNLNGSVDECRISNIARSADWITAEFNNQNSPSTFYTVGAQVPPDTSSTKIVVCVMQ